MPTQEQRPEQGLRNQTAILRDAAIEFDRREYEGASLASIAAVMGKPKAALRYHVGAKQELALGLLE